MKVSSINTVHSNVNFKSQKTDREFCPKCSSTDDTKALATGFVGVGLLGSALTAYINAKRNGTSPIKSLKNSFNKITLLLSNKPEPDKITKLLQGKRGTDAVTLYKKEVAQKKLTALQNRLLNGDFDGQAKSVFERIRKNETTYKRVLNIAV